MIYSHICFYCLFLKKCICLLQINLQLHLMSSQTKSWKLVKTYTFQKSSYKFTTQLIHAVFINDKYFAVIRVN